MRSRLLKSAAENQYVQYRIEFEPGIPYEDQVFWVTNDTESEIQDTLRSLFGEVVEENMWSCLFSESDVQETDEHEVIVYSEKTGRDIATMNRVGIEHMSDDEIIERSRLINRYKKKGSKFPTFKFWEIGDGFTSTKEPDLIITGDRANILENLKDKTGLEPDARIAWKPEESWYGPEDGRDWGVVIEGKGRYANDVYYFEQCEAEDLLDASDDELLARHKLKQGAAKETYKVFSAMGRSPRFLFYIHVPGPEWILDTVVNLTRGKFKIVEKYREELLINEIDADEETDETIEWAIWIETKTNGGKDLFNITRVDPGELITELSDDEMLKRHKNSAQDRYTWIVMPWDETSSAFPPFYIHTLTREPNEAKRAICKHFGWTERQATIRYEDQMEDDDEGEIGAGEFVGPNDEAIQWLEVKDVASLPDEELLNRRKLGAAKVQTWKMTPSDQNQPDYIETTTDGYKELLTKVCERFDWNTSEYKVINTNDYFGGVLPDIPGLDVERGSVCPRYDTGYSVGFEEVPDDKLTELSDDELLNRYKKRGGLELVSIKISIPNVGETISHVRTKGKRNLGMNDVTRQQILDLVRKAMGVSGTVVKTQNWAVQDSAAPGPDVSFYAKLQGTDAFVWRPSNRAPDYPPILVATLTEVPAHDLDDEALLERQRAVQR